MPVTTFLKEKIRDPRVKGAPSSSSITENLDINFTIGGEPINFTLKFDPVWEGNIILNFSELDIEDTIFISGTAQTYENIIWEYNDVNIIQINIIYDGRRNFRITYISNEEYDNLFPIEEIITFTYYPEEFRFIETAYMQYNTDAQINRFLDPTIYLHGKLADNNAIVAANLSSNAVTTAKLSQNCVTTDKIANANVTWAKLRCAVEEIPQSGGKYKWRIW